MNIPSKIYWFIALSTLLRIILAGSIELGNDEVYYITYAEKLQWNYFDHPPLVGLLIKLTTLNLYFTNEVFVRLGPIVMAACNTLIIYLIGRKLGGEKAGNLAVLFFTASPYSSIIAGLFIMPDAAMLFFWMLSVWLLIEIFDANTAEKQVNRYLVILGFTIGLATMGKVHAIFLWLGAGLYILFFRRQMLTKVYLYISVFISACVMSPILFWNIQNDFITYKFQGARVVAKGGFNPDSFLTELVGGILYNNPINYFLFIIALIGIFRHKIPTPIKSQKLLFCLSFPLIFTLLLISAFRSTLPHWSGPAFVALSILASLYLAEKKYQLYKKVLYGANTFFLLIAVCAATLINFYPGTIGSKDEKEFGDNDLTLELYGWKDFNKTFEKIRKDDIQQGVMPQKTFIVCNKWFPGGHLNFYVARPNKIDLIEIGDLNDIHHFYWLNQIRTKIKKGDDAYIIAPSNLNYALNVINFYGNYFETIESPTVVEQFRNGKKLRNFKIYRAYNFKGLQTK
jgi:hypothetical protein